MILGTLIMKAFFRLFFFFAMMVPPLAFAQTSSVDLNSKQPLEITADQTLEWHRNDTQFVANGNVVAKQGDTSIKSDRLTADYRTDKGKSFDIYKLTATGNVNIVSRGSTASGDVATYDLDRSIAVMTGKNLRLTSPEQVVTAQEKFEYHVNEGRLMAIGHAQAVRGEDKITADRMSAILNKNGSSAATPQNSMAKNLQRLEASGNVVITTPEETLTGDSGVYDTSTSIARLTGHVKITHGPNVLEGESAEVNLATNVSTMHGSATQGGRVRGLFYPDSVSSQKNDAAPGAAVPFSAGPLAR